ncbi:alpha-glucosidase [Microbacteriaceae bacterium MWH-Ta3]|nr:alpha-glucosidase [Microbacteriaceae bacterium MWH-Ta3]
MSEHTFLRGPADWWRDAVVYQVYPRSFADANGDGIGDLRGIISKVPYLSELGVDAIWISPFYPSALADGGYDVDDYRDIDPRIGTLAEFDELVDALHSRGMRIFIDVVPNHSSDRHVWFQEALAAGRGSAARERYIFREGRGDNGEIRPSELISHFGPTAWTRVEDGQWYLHLFTKEQPDFNWDHPEVREDFLKTFRFWSDRGVDGYRIDVAHALVKDMSEPLPSRDSYDVKVMKDDGTDRLFDRDEVHNIYATWREVFNQYDPPRVAVAEAWVPANRRPAYASTKGLGQAFNFDLLIAPWDATEFQSIIDYNLTEAAASGSSTTWVVSNHDVIRHVTRYALPDGVDEHEWHRSGGVNPMPDLAVGAARARAATALILALPGSTYLYQGEELGLPEPIVPDEHIQDPQWIRSSGEMKSRDGCRVPLPWEPTGVSFGFGPAAPHLPQPDWFANYAASVQDADPDSSLNFYRRALRIRKSMTVTDAIEWLDAPAGVMAFRRSNGWTSVTNFTAASYSLPVGEVVLATGAVTDGAIGPNTTVWLQTA